MTQEQADEQVDEKFEEILRGIIGELHAREGKDRVTVALIFLLVREANTWRSIRLLRKHTSEEFHAAFMVDAGTLLRAMFDANLQADFIFRDPPKRIQHATQYLDFQHVERYETMQKVLRHDNQITNPLKSSPYKAEGEKRVQQDYDRVKDQFLVEQKNCDGKVKPVQRTRDKWYKGGLFQLAEAACKADEYHTFVASFSGCVHSSAFAVRNGPMFPAEYIMVLATKFAARVAKINIDYNQLDIGENRMILDELCKSWFDTE